MAFNEKLEVVELNASNAVVSLLNLNDGAHYFMGTKTFKVIAPAPTRVEAADQRRWGGARQVGETHSNGIVSWEANVAGATSQEAIERVEVLLAQLAANPYPLYVLWQAAGVTEPTLYEMRGTGHFEPLFDVGVLEGAGLFPIQVEIPVAPLALGLPVNILTTGPTSLPATFSLTGIPGDAPAKAEVSIATGEAIPELVVGAHSPSGIVANSEHVYWCNQATGYIGRATLNGTTVEETWCHVEGAPYGLAIDSTYLYWTDTTAGHIGRVLVGGTSIEKMWINVSGSKPLGIAVSSEYLYWSGNGTHIARATIAGLFVEPIFITPGGGNKVEWVAVGNGYIYWSEPFARVIGRATVEGAEVDSAWIPVTGEPGGVAISSTTFYWMNVSTGYIGRANRHGGEVQGSWLYVNPTPAGITTPVGLTVTSEHVFWTNLAKGDIGRGGLSSPPISALLGWCVAPVSGLAPAPFGLLDSSEAEAISGWTYGVAEGARGGKALFGDVQNGTAAWNVDPATMTPDSFQGELTLEVWARMWVPPAQTPTVILSAQPQDGTGYGAPRWTDEWGSQGRTLTRVETASQWRFTRLGTLHLLVNPLAPRIWKLWLEGSVANVNVWGVDYLILVPALQRACSPSSKPYNASYPAFIQNTAPTVKTVRSNLSALIAKPGKNGHPDHGLGGQLMEVPPGNGDLLIKLSSLVPDDPTVSEASEQLEHEAEVTVTVTPRWFLTRTS